ncbi:MAG: GtrA family protein [Bacteroidales bacterium]|nr:GtrA family protein [Bacteroidales bacterium]
MNYFCKRLKPDNTQKLRELIRFCIVGIIATGIHCGIYLLAVNIAYTVGHVISFCANFVLSVYFLLQSAPSFKKSVGFAASHLIKTI